MKVAIILALVSVLIGCTARPINTQRNVDYWEPNQDWYTSLSDSPRSLKRTTGSIVHVSADNARNVFEVKSRISESSGFNVDIGIVDSSEINAYAFVRGGGNKIALSIGFIEKFGGDRDILAATIGHEIAHHLLEHTDGRRKAREVTTRNTAQIAGSLMNQIVPFSGYLTSYVITGFGRSYSREEEEEADKKGFNIAIKAGFDPCAGLGMLKSAGSEGGFNLYQSFLSTHPSYEYRIQSLLRYFETEHSRVCPR